MPPVIHVPMLWKFDSQDLHLLVMRGSFGQGSYWRFPELLSEAGNDVSSQVKIIKDALLQEVVEDETPIHYCGSQNRLNIHIGQIKNKTYRFHLVGPTEDQYLLRRTAKKMPGGEMLEPPMWMNELQVKEKIIERHSKALDMALKILKSRV